MIYITACLAQEANMVKSRLMIVSRDAKKSQRPLSELFTRKAAKKLANALAKPL